MFRGVFYRVAEPLLVDRIPDGGEAIPVAFFCVVKVNAASRWTSCCMDEGDLAILFSYTRAYFRVEAPSPYDLVKWLRELMPLKRAADLYNAIGFNRHAKTEFYRDFVAHLNASADRFKTAEGAPGMVMLVFTLPSYDVVFKVIKDRFDFPRIPLQTK